MDLRQRAARLKTDIPAVCLAFRHKGTPLGAKLLAGAILIYALSPIDLIPDFIPVLGYLDDVILLPALIALTLRLIPREVLDDCRRQAKEQQTGGRKRWRYALPFIAIWLLAALLILKAVFW